MKTYEPLIESVFKENGQGYAQQKTVVVRGRFIHTLYFSKERYFADIFIWNNFKLLLVAV